MRLQLSKVPLVDGWMAGWMGGWMRGAGARCSCTPDHPSESGLAPTGPSGARAHSGQQIPFEHSQVARTASYLRAGNPRSQSPFTDRRRYCTCLAPPVQRTIGTGLSRPPSFLHSHSLCLPQTTTDIRSHCHRDLVPSFCHSRRVDMRRHSAMPL